MTLSDRQLELVELVGARRLSYKAAAREMGLSIYTVHEYAAGVRDVLGLEINPRDALFVAWMQVRETLPSHP